MKNNKKKLGFVFIGIASLLLLSSIGVEARFATIEVLTPIGSIKGTGLKGVTVVTIIVSVIFYGVGLYLIKSS